MADPRIQHWPSVVAERFLLENEQNFFASVRAVLGLTIDWNYLETKDMKKYEWNTAILSVNETQPWKEGHQEK